MTDFCSTTGNLLPYYANYKLKLRTRVSYKNFVYKSSSDLGFLIQACREEANELALVIFSVVRKRFGNMETVLENLSMDATAGKLKAITDACDEGLGKNQLLRLEIFPIVRSL